MGVQNLILAIWTTASFASPPKKLVLLPDRMSFEIFLMLSDCTKGNKLTEIDDLLLVFLHPLATCLAANKNEMSIVEHF